MLASLNPSTLGCAVSIVLVSIALLALFFQLTTKTYPGSGFWTASLALLACTFLSLLLRGRIPEAVGILTTNYCLFLGLCLFYDGIARFHDRAGRFPVNPLNHGLALATVAMLMLSFYAADNIGLRIALFNVFQIFIAVRLCALIASVAPRKGRAIHLLLGSVFLTLTAISIARIYTVLTAPPILFMARDDIGLRLIMLIGLILGLVIWFSILLLTHHRIEEELEDARNRAEHVSRTDRLTGLWNRYHFEAQAKLEIERSIRYGYAISLLMLDIDHFKRVNDYHGHFVGDDILRQVAQCASESMRASDLLCRWGGEEFVALVPGTAAEAAKAAENLRKCIEQHDFPKVGKTTISIGVAKLREAEDMSDWMRRADSALYRAKSNGRNRVEKEAPEMSSGYPVSLQWNAGFTCGHSVIDDQHQALFDKANQLLEKCGAPQADGVIELMEDFLHDVERHFRYEESVLTAVDYARLGEHIEEHRRLLAIGRARLEAFKAGLKPASVLSGFAIKELSFGHFVEEDAHYTPFVGQAGKFSRSDRNDIAAGDLQSG